MDYLIKNVGSIEYFLYPDPFEKCSKADALKIATKWHLYISVAARYLYRAVDTALTRN